MGLFQKAILRKYLKGLDDKITSAYQQFVNYFHNPEIQENIRNCKEEQFQEGFLRELFVKVLGYTLKPEPNFNLITEQKNETDSKKADGAILINDEIVGVIELKDTTTTDLKQVEGQAFGYKNNHRNAIYVIISNFEKLRFYIDNAIDFIEFNLFTLNQDDFAVLWLCLAYSNISINLPKQIKDESISSEDKITKQFYNEYASFKQVLFEDLLKKNPSYDKLTLFKKSQKLLDRLLFILFAEDSGLLPPNSIAEVIKNWESLKELDEYRPLYERFKKYFSYLNTGHKGKKHDIFAYNGGLFAQDDILDNIEISDDVLLQHLSIINRYDFSSEVDVNILGHIFEHSLSEIEEITNSIAAQTGFVNIEQKNIGKRKKDGVFYTPRYITVYIVENTLGKLCTEKKNELGINEAEYSSDRKRQKATITKIEKRILDYRNWLLSLTICDPACGSGAFLNAALDFLINEHNLINEMRAKIHNESYQLFDNIENDILENNLFGVDINEESVEIAKLALWLRTAKPNRKLNSLNENIKCGNSLISDPSVAGDKAFDWKKEFPHVFANGGFDVVIGNPPYLVIKGGRWLNGFEYNKDSIKYIKKIFTTAEQQINTYVLFLEHAKFLAKQDGIISQITPNTYFTNEYSKKLRLFLLQKCDLLELRNTGLVFADATVETAIITFTNSFYKDKTKIINKDNNFEINLMDLCVMSEDSKYLVNLKNNEIKLLNKLNKNEKLNKFAKVWRGLTTGNDEKYLSDKKLSDNYKPIITGSEVYRYLKCKNKLYVNYLPEELDRARDERIFLLEEKLISKFIGTRLAFCYDNEKNYVINTACSLELTDNNILIKYLLCLLNSNLLDFYFKRIYSDSRDVFPLMKSGNIEHLPIYITSLQNQQSFSDLAEKMLLLNNELNISKNRFLKRLTDNLNNIKITKKIEDFEKLDFKQFVAELKKQKITLTLKQQDEWEAYFNDYKGVCSAAVNHIEATDRVIDQMVYELYGLTEEEVKVVEG